jgi:hypothetical protein
MTENQRAWIETMVGTGIARATSMAIFISEPEAGQSSADHVTSAQPYAYASRDPRALRIVAKTIYREMRNAGLTEEDLMSVAGEMLSLVAGDMKDRRDAAENPTAYSQATRR